MKTIAIIIVFLTMTSCYKWRLPTANNKFLTVLKRDGNLTRTKARIVSDLHVEYSDKADTLTSYVISEKATVTKTIKRGYTIPARSKGKIVEDKGNYYFVFKDKDYLKLPINVDNHSIYIKTIDNKVVATQRIVNTPNPGFELKIKEKTRTESIKENN